jgi:hypothetical protein
MASGALKRSLASWREVHGVGILCIISPLGEHFLVHPAHEANAATDFAGRTVESWPPLSESQAKDWLAERGLSAIETEDAIRLTREWATTITGSGALAARFTRP